MTTRSWPKTLLGVVFCAFMLFPVYWMVNVSLTQTGDLRRSTPRWFPTDPTFEGYSAAVSQQLPSLGTSLVVGLGCVALTVVIAAPPGTRWRSSTCAAARRSTSCCWSPR
ncbi:hypothetical protein GCM10029992_17880 [Glycomyces albus]